ncbi:hypothetical protein YC2023_108450 [Brassica napus]
MGERPIVNKYREDFEKRVKECLKLSGGKRMGAGDASWSDAERSNPVCRSIRGVDRRGLNTDQGVRHVCESTGFECEHACRDPKDGELCLSGAKPEETLVEARSDTDVQILGRGGCFVEPSHGIESSKWAIFGKQNWRCGMNWKPGYGAQLHANLEPTKGVGRLRQQDGGHGSRNPLRSV